MNKAIKTFTFMAMTAFFLNACADSATINQQAAQSYTQEMGKMRAKGAIDTTSDTARRIHTVFKRMVPYANQENHTGQPFYWQLNVIRSNEINAWAMPGGKMVFYTGLVERLHLNDNEIATVMGHEMAHALKEHGKSQANFDMVTGILAQVGHTALSTVVGEEMSGYAIGLTKDWGLDKPHSRSAETEADEVGLMLMARAGYNPQAAIGLWDKMKHVGGNGGGVLAALSSSHPSDENRQANLERLLPEAMRIYQQAQ